MKPEEQYADAGFVNGQTIVDSHDKGIALEGRVQGVPNHLRNIKTRDRPSIQRISKCVSMRKTRKYPCWPVRKNKRRQTLCEVKKTGKTLVHFDASVCKECKVNTRCPVKIGVGVATLTIDEASYAGAARHHQYMENTDYRKRCAIRAGAEATVSEMVRAHGVRRSKHRTEGRTRLQMLFAAIACNVKRFIRHGVLHGYVVSVTAVTTPFRRCFCCTNGF